MIKLRNDANARLKELVYEKSVRAYYLSVCEHYKNGHVTTFITDFQILLTKLAIMICRVSIDYENCKISYCYGSVNFLSCKVLNDPMFLKRFCNLRINEKGNTNKHDIQSVEINMRKCIIFYNDLVNNIAKKYNVSALKDMLIPIIDDQPSKQTRFTPTYRSSLKHVLSEKVRKVFFWLMIASIIVVALWVIWMNIQGSMDSLIYLIAVPGCVCTYSTLMWLALKISDIKFDDDLMKKILTVACGVLLVADVIVYLIMRAQGAMIYKCFLIGAIIVSMVATSCWKYMRERIPHMIVAWFAAVLLYLNKLIPNGTWLHWEWFIGIVVFGTAVLVLVLCEFEDKSLWYGWVILYVLNWGFFLLFNEGYQLIFFIAFVELIAGNIIATILAFKNYAGMVKGFYICFLLLNIGGLIFNFLT